MIRVPRTSRPACIFPPAWAAGPVPAARVNCPAASKKAPLSLRCAAARARAASSTSLTGSSRHPRARARRARPRGAPRRGSCSHEHKSNQSVPLKRLATSGQLETRSAQGTHAGGEAPGRARRGLKIARRSSAKAQMAFLEVRRSYVTVRQVPPNFFAISVEEELEVLVCSPASAAQAYAFAGSM